MPSPQAVPQFLVPQAQAGMVCQHLVIHPDSDGRTAGRPFLVLVLSGDL